MAPAAKILCSLLGICSTSTSNLAPRDGNLQSRYVTNDPWALKGAMSRADCEKISGPDCHCFLNGVQEKEREDCFIERYNEAHRYNYTEIPYSSIPWEWSGKMVYEYEEDFERSSPLRPRVYKVNLIDLPESKEGDSIHVAQGSDPYTPLGEMKPGEEWEIRGEIRVFDKGPDPNFGERIPMFVGTFRNKATNRCMTFRRGPRKSRPLYNNIKSYGDVISMPCEPDRNDQKFIMWMWYQTYKHGLIPYEDHWDPRCRDPKVSGTNWSTCRGIQADSYGNVFVDGEVVVGCGMTLFEFYPTGFFRAEGPHKNAGLPENTWAWYPSYPKWWTDDAPVNQQMKDVFYDEPRPNV